MTMCLWVWTYRKVLKVPFFGQWAGYSNLERPSLADMLTFHYQSPVFPSSLVILLVQLRAHQMIASGSQKLASRVNGVATLSSLSRICSSIVLPLPIWPVFSLFLFFLRCCYTYNKFRMKLLRWPPAAGHPSVSIANQALPLPLSS